MPRNKRPVKAVRSIRLDPFHLEILLKMSDKLKVSEGRMVEIALAEYFRSHPELWPEGDKS